MKNTKSRFVIAMLGLGLSVAMVGAEKTADFPAAQQKEVDVKKQKEKAVAEYDEKSVVARELDIVTGHGFVSLTLNNKELCRLHGGAKDEPFNGVVESALCSGDNSMVVATIFREPGFGKDALNYYVTTLKDGGTFLRLKEPYLGSPSYVDPIRFSPDNSVYVIYTRLNHERALRFFPKGSDRVAKEVVLEKSSRPSGEEYDDYHLVHTGKSKYWLYERHLVSGVYINIAKFTVEETPAKK